MRIYLSLGSNLGNKKKWLKKAIEKLKSFSSEFKLSRLSPIYESPALLPEGAPPEWNLPYINLVVELKHTKKDSQGEKSPSIASSPDLSQEEKKSRAVSLLNQIKKIEKDLGREGTQRGAPRVIDIDILLWEGLKVSSKELSIPHKGMHNRPFCLVPLKDLLPNIDLKKNFFFSPSSKCTHTFSPPPLTTELSSKTSHLSLTNKETTTTLKEIRKQNFSAPLWMAILNVTPDSFSDGGLRKETNLKAFEKEIQALEKAGVHILDIGGEATGPGAKALNSKEEWTRVFPFLQFLKKRYQNQILRPLISLDTRHAETAEKGLEWGVDWINDVSGLKDAKMLSVLKNHPTCHYVLTHSLSLPANPAIHLSASEDPVLTLKKWCQEKIHFFEKEGLDLNRFLFDPGIGFGKTSLQSLNILKRIKEFHDLPLRLLIGASRKSFMNSFTSKKFEERDLETLGLSLWLTSQSVDVLRVHDVLSHTRVFLAWSHMKQKERLEK